LAKSAVGENVIGENAVRGMAGAAVGWPVRGRKRGPGVGRCQTARVLARARIPRRRVTAAPWTLEAPRSGCPLGGRQKSDGASPQRALSYWGVQRMWFAPFVSSEGRIQ
jgi:hypothetical protein